MVSFNQLSWAAFCYYYKSSGDKKYIHIMADQTFLEKLRHNPTELYPEELEQKLILDYVNVINYDLLIGNRIAESILNTIVTLQPDIKFLAPYSIINVDLDDQTITNSICNIYTKLSAVKGLWLTGVSKIAHTLNDQLLPILGLEIVDRFPEVKSGDCSVLRTWLQHMQDDSKSLMADYSEEHHDDSPERYLSDCLGYSQKGVVKSMNKYIDEYYWLTYGEQMSFPPAWIPEYSKICQGQK